MKTVSLFILTLVALYNPKVGAYSNEIDIQAVDNYNFELSRISLSKNDPIKDIDENLINFNKLIHLYKAFQSYDTELTNKILTKIQNRNTLSGNDLYLIKRTFQTYYSYNSKIIEFASLYRSQFTSWAKFKMSKAESVKDLKAQLIWLNAIVVIMEHTEAVHEILYLTNGNFRRIFKNTFTPSEITLEEKISLEQFSKQMSLIIETLEDTRYAQQIILIRETADQIKKTLGNDDLAHYLVEVIQTNKVATDLARGKKKFKLQLFGINDSAVGTFNKLTNFLSRLFGNVAGNIQWRKGFLFDNKLAIDHAKKTLKPMDILLEKSPFALTDKFIPGHYGHSALYLGTKEQLIEIGMWNHPELIAHQKEIEEGNTILEAVRAGVRFNSIEGFMNIDEYSIVRKSDGLQSGLQVAEQITRGIEQLGKDYDFNFDISTLDRIVCSELIYIVFGHVNWPTQYRFGRPTITPDDVGETLFMKNSPFKMTDYIFSTERQKIQKADIFKLAEIYDYELRAENGDPIKDPEDSSNSFWKKETKCYKIAKSTNLSRVCKTTYKEFYYEEQPSL